MRTPALAALALLAGGCGANILTGVFGLQGPVSMVFFKGVTHSAPGQVNPYVAIANMQGDELRILDPGNNVPVMSPGFANALSVPTLPSPNLVGAASLNDVDASGHDLAWLLVAASAAAQDTAPPPNVPAGLTYSQTLQVVSTWEEFSRVVSYVDLSGVAGSGAVILSLRGIPAFAVGSTTATAGAARMLVGISGASDGSGGKLAVVPFARGADGQSVVQAGPPVVRSLGFDPASLAFDARSDATHVYIASRDPITDSTGVTAYGVARIDISNADPTAWTVQVLKTGPSWSNGAPTALVEVIGVQERNVAGGADAWYPVQPRVYAVLDASPTQLPPSGCGPDEPIACGIAILDPVGGGIAGEIAASGGGVPSQGYRTPIQLPGMPIGMAATLPPNGGGQQQVNAAGIQEILLAPLTGSEWSTAAMVVGASDGLSYIIDLGRSGPPDDISLLNDDSSRVKAYNAGSSIPTGTPTPTAVLGLWQLPYAPSVAPYQVVADTTGLGGAIMATPGFTPADTWTITFQGALPGLYQRPAAVINQGGTVYVAIQVTDAMTGNLVPLAEPDDPRLGIHPVGFTAAGSTTPESGDTVVVVPDAGSVSGPSGVVPCPSEEVPVQALVAGGTGWPGGAISLGSGPFACLDPGPGNQYAATITVRASGLVLTGSTTGYAGRPALDPDGPTGSLQPFRLAWQDEGTLYAQCPLDRPQDPLPACLDATPSCRPACEQLVLARKARRFYYPVDATCIDYCSSTPYYPWISDFLAAGPALEFRVGKVVPTGAVSSDPVRDMALVFSTETGVTPSSRQPTSNSLPTAAVAVDRSVIPGHLDDGAWFYVAYGGGLILGFPPGMSIASALTLQ